MKTFIAPLALAILALFTCPAVAAHSPSDQAKFTQLVQILKSKDALKLPSVAIAANVNESTIAVEVVNLLKAGEKPYPLGDRYDALNALHQREIQAILKERWESTGPADDLKVLSGGFPSITVILKSGAEDEAAKSALFEVIAPSQLRAVQELLSTTVADPLFCTYLAFQVYDDGSSIYGDTLLVINPYGIDEAIVIRIYFADT